MTGKDIRHGQKKKKTAYIEKDGKRLWSLASIFRDRFNKCIYFPVHKLSVKGQYFPIYVFYFNILIFNANKLQLLDFF